MHTLLSEYTVQYRGCDNCLQETKLANGTILLVRKESEREQHIIFTGQTGSRGTANDSRLSAQMLHLSAARYGWTWHCLVRHNKGNFPELVFFPLHSTVYKEPKFTPRWKVAISFRFPQMLNRGQSGGSGREPSPDRTSHKKSKFKPWWWLLTGSPNKDQVIIFNHRLSAA